MSIMSVSTILGVSLSVVVLSTLVAGDSGTIITMNSIKVTNNANDYLDPWSIEIGKGKKSSQLNAKIPSKKELPDNAQITFFLQLEGQEPIEQTTTFCDALNDKTIGESFVEAGIPKDKFPKECPFVAGDWAVEKWDPPSDAVPPGVPDGPFSGYVTVFEEGKDPHVKIDFEGELSHEQMGR